MYYHRKVIQGMQKENLQKRRLACKEWLQFTVQIKSNYSCPNEGQRKTWRALPRSIPMPLFVLTSSQWILLQKCLYKAVVVFFIKCRWVDLHFAPGSPVGLLNVYVHPRSFHILKTHIIFSRTGDAIITPVTVDFIKHNLSTLFKRQFKLWICSCTG